MRVQFLNFEANPNSKQRTVPEWHDQLNILTAATHAHHILCVLHDVFIIYVASSQSD